MKETQNVLCPESLSNAYVGQDWALGFVRSLEALAAMCDE